MAGTSGGGPPINPQRCPFLLGHSKSTLWSLLRRVLLVVTSGYLLSENTTAALPYVDAFTTWYAVVTTYMVTKKILENWGYWFVIDSVSVYLYYSRGLYLTALLFVAYLIIIVFGYLKWKKEYDQQMSESTLEGELSK